MQRAAHPRLTLMALRQPLMLRHGTTSRAIFPAGANSKADIALIQRNPEKKKSLQDLREAMMASLASVTREQFKIRSELEVVHIPTGAVFRAHPYSNPDDMLESVKVNWGRAGVPPEGDCADQVQRMASQLLLERAARDRRLGMRLENI